MDKVNWVIDRYLFTEYEDRLSNAILNSGGTVHFYDDLCGKPFKGWMLNNFTQNDIVVFHGSLQHGRQLSHLPIYPGVFMTIDNYECYKYYGYYGENLLNSDYLMMGLNDVVRCKHKILKTLIETKALCVSDVDEMLFIRPSNGYKTFAGQIINWKNIDNEISLIVNSYGGIDTDTLVMLSKVQDLIEEYRFIVVNGEVISGSLYLDENNMKTHRPYYNMECVNQDAINFAIKMATIYTPDKAYTIDVCKTRNGEYKLLEINSFNCASMYGANLDLIVKSINELAITEHNDLFGAM